MTDRPQIDGRTRSGARDRPRRGGTPETYVRTTEASPACLWCGKPFQPRRDGGSRQSFCGAQCRHRFHAGARRWAERAVATRVLTVADLKNGDPAACTLLRGRMSPAQVPEEGKAAALLYELLDEVLDDAFTGELSAEVLGRIIAYLDDLVP